MIRVPRNKKELAFIHLVNNPLELKLNKLNIYTSKEIPKRTGQKYTCLLYTSTTCRLLNASRSDDNPNGFTIEGFTIIENKDLQTIKR